ncbi:MAG: adenylate/guanylate cyclase domain-containing protein [Pseudolabrys sp.]
MNDPQQEPATSQVDPRYLRTADVFERPLAVRPHHDSIDAIVAWLIGPARRIASGLETFDEFAWRLLATGIPLLRVTLHGRTLHPQYLGTSMQWWRTTGKTAQIMIGHEVGDTMRYEDNPVLRVALGGETLRRRLDGACAPLDFPILQDLKAEGATDYLALPVPAAHGDNYMLSYVTDRPGGFTDAEIDDLKRVSQFIAGVADMHTQRAISRNVLNAYLGASTGPKVLAGHIRRGTGEALAAVLWASDLRGFTERSDRLPGDRMIAVLNALFDAQAEAIAVHGGEILKFIGDGMLAIFPLDGAQSQAEAARNALAAASEAIAAIARLTETPCMDGEPPLKVVVALHVGTAFYGNIGAADRLDFTVIGPAVNLVSRIQSVGKRLDLPIIVSDDFARAYAAPLPSLGRHTLRGLALPHELFAPALPVPDGTGFAC